MNKGYFKDKAGVLSEIRGAYADTGDGTARRVLKAYVGGRDNRARLWFEHLRRVRSIAVTTPPAKVIYTAGDVFDPAGMVITATYQDGGTAAVTDYTCSPAGPLRLSDTEVTIRYEINGTDASVTLPVRVTDEPFYVTGIAIVTPPTKTAYFYGETFLSAGIAVTASYSDGSTADVTAECTFTPLRALELGDTAITATYRENGFTVTAVQPITVVRRLTGIAVASVPHTVEYMQDEVFDPAGMEIVAYYNDGWSRPVTEFTYTPTGVLTAADTAILISYAENGIVVTTEQAITVNTNAEIVKRAELDVKLSATRLYNLSRFHEEAVIIPYQANTAGSRVPISFVDQDFVRRQVNASVTSSSGFTAGAQAEDLFILAAVTAANGQRISSTLTLSNFTMPGTVTRYKPPSASFNGTAYFFNTASSCYAVSDTSISTVTFTGNDNRSNSMCCCTVNDRYLAWTGGYQSVTVTEPSGVFKYMDETGVQYAAPDLTHPVISASMTCAGDYIFVCGSQDVASGSVGTDYVQVYDASTFMQSGVLSMSGKKYRTAACTIDPFAVISPSAYVNTSTGNSGALEGFDTSLLHYIFEAPSTSVSGNQYFALQAVNNYLFYTTNTSSGLVEIYERI